jgi:hypothetical protein
MPMKRVWGPAVAGLIAVGTAGAVVSACSHDDSTIFISGVIAPPLVSPGSQCAVSANPTQAFRNSGRLDVNLASSYSAAFLVGNQMVAQADPTVPRTETSFVDVQGAIVRITNADGSPVTTYTDLFGGSIPPASGGTPGYAALSATIVDSSTVMNLEMPLQTMAAQFGMSDVIRLITYTKIFGKSLGGQYVESNEFEFPVDVCANCLIAFSPADIRADCLPQPNCVGNSVGTTAASNSVPCQIGQDDIVDCSQCLENRSCNPPVRCGLDGGLTD